MKLQYLIYIFFINFNGISAMAMDTSFQTNNNQTFFDISQDFSQDNNLVMKENLSTISQYLDTDSQNINLKHKHNKENIGKKLAIQDEDNVESIMAIIQEIDNFLQNDVSDIQEDLQKALNNYLPKDLKKDLDNYLKKALDNYLQEDILDNNLWQSQQEDDIKNIIDNYLKYGKLDIQNDNIKMPLFYHLEYNNIKRYLYSYLQNLLITYFYKFFSDLDDTEANNPLESHLTLSKTLLTEIIEKINAPQNNLRSILKKYPRLYNNLLVWTLKQSESIREIPLLSPQQIESLAKDSRGNVKLYLLAEYTEESKELQEFKELLELKKLEESKELKQSENLQNFEDLKRLKNLKRLEKLVKSKDLKEFIKSKDLKEFIKSKDLKEPKKLKLMNISDSLIIGKLSSCYKGNRHYSFPFGYTKNKGGMDLPFLATEDNYEDYSPIHTYGIYVKNIKTHKYEELQKNNPIKIKERIYINKKGVRRSIYQIVLDENNYTAESLQDFLQKNTCSIYYGNLEIELLFQKLHWGVLNNRYIRAILKEGNSYYKCRMQPYGEIVSKPDSKDTKKTIKKRGNYNVWQKVDLNNYTQGKNNIALILDKNTMGQILKEPLLPPLFNKSAGIDSYWKKKVLKEEIKESQEIEKQIAYINEEFFAHVVVELEEEESTIKFDSIEKTLDNNSIFNLKKSLIISNYKLNCYLLCVLFDYYDPKESYKKYYNSNKLEERKFDDQNPYNDLLTRIFKTSISFQGKKNLFRLLEFNLYEYTTKTLEELAEFCLSIIEIIDSKKKANIIEKLKKEIEDSNNKITEYEFIRKEKEADIMKLNLPLQQEVDKILNDCLKEQNQKENQRQLSLQEFDKMLLISQESNDKSQFFTGDVRKTYLNMKKLDKEIKSLENQITKYKLIIGQREKQIFHTTKLKLPEEKKSLEKTIAQCKSTKEKNEEEFKKLQEERRILQIEIEDLENQFPIFKSQLIKSVETIEDLENTTIVNISDESKEKIKELWESFTKYKSLEKEKNEKLHKILELEKKITTLDQNLIIYNASKIRKIERFYEVENLQEKIQDLQEEFTKYYDQNIKIDDKKQVENSINHLTKEMFRNLDKLLKVNKNQEKISESFYSMIGRISEIFQGTSYFPKFTPLSVFLIMNFKYEAISYEERHKTSLNVTLPF